MLIGPTGDDLIHGLQINQKKRESFLKVAQPKYVKDVFELWLGVFIPSFPCPRLHRIGDYGDGGKVRPLKLSSTTELAESMMTGQRQQEMLPRIYGGSFDGTNGDRSKAYVTCTAGCTLSETSRASVSEALSSTYRIACVLQFCCAGIFSVQWICNMRSLFKHEPNSLSVVR